MATVAPTPPVVSLFFRGFVPVAGKKHLFRLPAVRLPMVACVKWERRTRAIIWPLLGCVSEACLVCCFAYCPPAAHTQHQRRSARSARWCGKKRRRLNTSRPGVRRGVYQLCVDVISPCLPEQRDKVPTDQNSKEHTLVVILFILKLCYSRNRRLWNGAIPPYLLLGTSTYSWRRRFS